MTKNLMNTEVINQENFDFNTPSKTEEGFYMALLKNGGITSQLPRLPILSTGKNKRGQYEIWYHLDLESDNGENLVNFFYMLDEAALKSASKNSEKWFGKKIEEESLEKLYIPPYDEDKNGNIYTKLVIKNDKLLRRFNEPHHISVISIEGLEFYKSKFQYSIVVKNVIINPTLEVESNIDFVKYLDKKANLEKIMTDNSNKVITDEVINELAIDNDLVSIDDNSEDNQSSDNESLNNDELLDNDELVDNKLNKAEVDTQVTTLSKLEVETIVTQSRNEARQCFINAERASRAAENLRLKAIKAANELKKAENLLELVSQNE